MEKAAQGIFTDELRAEQKKLTSASETRLINDEKPAFETLETKSTAETAAKLPTSGFSVPNRDEAGFFVKPTESDKPHRAFFEPPRVTIPPRPAPAAAQTVPTAAAAPVITAADLERVAEATAQAVTENLMRQINTVVAAVLTEAAARVKTEMTSAVNEAVARGIREGLEKARRH